MTSDSDAAALMPGSELSTLHTLIHFHLPDMVQDVDASAHFSDGETEERAVPCGGQLGCVPDPCQ